MTQAGSRRAMPIEFAAAVLRQSGRSSISTAALVAASALLDGAGLLLLAPLLGVITGSGEGWIQRGATKLFVELGVSSRLSRLWLLLALFLMLSTLRALVNNRRDLALAALQTGFAESERNRLIDALAGTSWPRLAALHHSETTALLSSEVQRVANGCNYLVQASVQIVLLAVQTIVIFLLAPALALAAVALLALGMLAFVLGRRHVHGLGEGVVKASHAMMASAAALLGGLKSALAQNGQHLFVAEFKASQAALTGHQLAFAARQARGRMAYSIGSAILASGLVAAGIGLFAVPAANLLTIVLVVARMGAPAQQVYQSGQMLVFTVPAFEAIRRAERALPAAARASPRPLRPPDGAIALSRVTYLHPGGGGVRDVDLVLEPGRFVGVGGPSGAGKTTLADLVVGLLVPQSGAITVGGERLAGAFRGGWSECVAYVPQDGFLFHDTVRRNLLWGAPQADDCGLRAVLKLVGAEPLIDRLDHGLDTTIGERGSILSGGERQRLVLARALLRKPRLLLLDEAANAIDAEGEALLLSRLRALDPSPTIVLISHREASLDRCDMVVRVDQGLVSIER